MYLRQGDLNVNSTFLVNATLGFFLLPHPSLIFLGRLDQIEWDKWQWQRPEPELQVVQNFKLSRTWKSLESLEKSLLDILWATIILQ